MSVASSDQILLSRFGAIPTLGMLLLGTSATIACSLRLSNEVAAVPPTICVTLVLLSLLWSCVTRYAWHATRPELSDQNRWIIAGLPLVAVLIVARCLTFEGISAFSTFFIWFAVVAEEGLLLSLLFADQWSSTTQKPLVTQPAEPSIAIEPEEAHSELPEGTSQQLTRAIIGQQEHVHGLLRCELASNQRHAYLHVGFCPPLATLPQVELNQTDGPELQIQVGQIMTTGVRFDLKLRSAQPTEQSAVFEFMATSEIACSTEMKAAS